MKKTTDKKPAPATVEPAFSFPPLTKVATEELKKLAKELKDEIKKRDEEEQAKKPTDGETVLIKAAGRFQGQLGTVVLARKTRAFVRVEGFKQPAYVKYSDREKVS